MLVTTTGLGPEWDAGMPGVLAFRFSDDPDDFVAWYRRDVTKHVHWAGNPDKPVEVNEQGEVRLSPRLSFEKWTETVRGTAEQWERHAVDAAAALQQSLRNVAIRIAALQDEIDRRTRSEEHLLELTRDLEAFAYAASHDLRQPARNMTMRLTMLAQQLGDVDESTRRSLERATEGSYELHRLIDSMNALCKSSTEELRIGEVSLGGVLDRVEESLGDAMRASDATIQRGALGTVRADPKLLERVLANLIENAIKYRDPGRAPIVNIEAKVPARPGRGEAAAVVSVRDNGIGIADQDAQRVFKPFGRAKTDRPVEGTGLGLAICKRIAQRHRGDIELNSVVGEGTEFRVKIGQLEAPSGASSSPAPNL